MASRRCDDVIGTLYWYFLTMTFIIRGKAPKCVGFVLVPSAVFRELEAVHTISSFRV